MKWRKIQENKPLPKDDEEVFCYGIRCRRMGKEMKRSTERIVCQGLFDILGRWCYTCEFFPGFIMETWVEDVTHWMPFPKPPK